MSRQLHVVGAGVDRPDERHIRAEDRVGPSIAVRIASEDLKARPVHSVRLTEDEAIRLIAQLAEAVSILRKS
jgi:hypothetical protein